MQTNISIYGRGGQGVKTCAHIIALAALKAGNHIQAFPEYGPERRGAPVKAFVKISKKPIRSHEPITQPDYVIVINDNLLKVLPELKTNKGLFIINTKKKLQDIPHINATKISLEEIKINNPNIVLIGCLLKIFENQNKNVFNYKNVETTIKNIFAEKNKHFLIEPNLNCLKRGFQELNFSEKIKNVK